MHPNIKAYEGVEDVSKFSSSSFEEYIKVKLEECGKHIKFIKKNIIDDQYKGCVLEIGSGNGKLLFRLEEEGMLQQGIGYELAGSRTQFAKKLGKHLNSTKVSNINGNFLSISPQGDKYDLVIGVDIVIPLISPLSETAENDWLRVIKSLLKKNGWLILELQDFKNTLKMIQLSGGELRIWKEFHASDPWQYGLDTYSIHGKDIVWDKTFIKRDLPLEKSSFTNILRPYARDEIRDLLESAGFDKVQIFDYWSEPGDTEREEYIVIARQGN